MIARIALLSFLAVSFPVCAELTELGKEANVVPIEQAVGDLLSRYRKKSIPMTTMQQTPTKTIRSKARLMPTTLPITSRLQVSANTSTQRIDTPLQQPICLVGTDQTSRQWLQNNRAQLINLNARCILVEAQNQIEVQNVIDLAKPIPVSAIAFDTIAEQHGIEHYPVLLIGKVLSDVQ